ncbi:plakophilin-1 [Nematolebias whitei]|uniref:plakophilin-1 n=1 Tax=Nematolebias whitei TaxID=451745 RepID=UPI001897F3CC|nr:plakophilin-1 [Nematolebias whitei]
MIESNGSVFFTNGFSKSFSLEKNINNPQTLNNLKKTTRRRNATYSSSRYENGYGVVGSLAMGQTNTSRSEPALAWHYAVPKLSVPPQRGPSNKSIYTKHRSSSNSQSVKRITSQLRQKNVPNGLDQIQTQYPTLVPKSPGQLRTRQSMIASNGSSQIQTQYPTNVPNGSGPMKTRHSMILSNSSGQIQTQYPTNVPDGSGPVKTRHSMILSNSSGQIQTQYPTVVPNSPGQMIKMHRSTIVPKSSGQTQTQHVKSSQTGITKTQPTIVTDGSTKTKENSGAKETISAAGITLKEAVEFLSKDDENYQHCGASYIQHNTFISDTAKEEVLRLKGIPPLVNLLRSSSSQVKYTASATLRNLSYKSDRNKEEIHRCNGILVAADQLRDSDSVELDKQLTGLLWNLSSADNLKPDLLKNALFALTERVRLPSTNKTATTERDPEVFFHATGCLRNLSSAKQESRQMMRKHQGLVDSLVGYIKECVDTRKDDESLVNCVCTLHNLTYKLESEAPVLFSKINALASNKPRSRSQNNVSTVGCFSSNKSPEYEYTFDYPVSEDRKPSGASSLFHSTTLQSYLSLIDSCQREETQETCCKIMQNLTANESVVSSVMSQMIVQKLNGMQIISPLLTSDKINLQKSAMALVANLMKNPNLHTAIGNRALPELVDVLKKGTDGANESDDTLAMACQSASTLLLNEPEFNKKCINLNLIESLKDISKNKYFPKSSKAASILLLKMWSDKDLQSHLRKEGMTKNIFVNDITMAAYKSAQAI